MPTNADPNPRRMSRLELLERLGEIIDSTPIDTWWPNTITYGPRDPDGRGLACLGQRLFRTNAITSSEFHGLNEALAREDYQRIIYYSDHHLKSDALLWVEHEIAMARLVAQVKQRARQVPVLLKRAAAFLFFLRLA